MRTIISKDEEPVTVVEVNHLFKSYSGKTAVNDQSFSVISGEILGLIGPNRAGKSTTIKTMRRCTGLSGKSPASLRTRR